MSDTKRILSSVVRIISQNINFDWFSPYKNAGSSESIGSGWFINDKGFFLTAAHVVTTAIKIWITVPINGKQKYEAEIIKICPESDLALMKVIDYNNVDYLEIGDSDKLKYGESLTAVGYPIGQDKLKYTAGVFSGIQDNMIQTDTPINPGNSGGPLLDSKHMVVGINTAGMSGPDVENIGFATPINEYKIISKQLFSEGHIIIEKPVFGCSFNNASEDLFRAYDIKGFDKFNPQGILINLIFKHSALYNAGLRKEDILICFDRYIIDMYGECIVPWSNEKIDINGIISRYNVGDVVNIYFWSRGLKKIIKNKVKLQPGSAIYKINWKHPKFEKIDYEIFGGMIVMELTMNHINHVDESIIHSEQKNDLITYLEFKKKIFPVLIITDILKGSYLSTLNIIYTGEIIHMINDIKVSTLAEYRNAIVKPYKQNFIKIETVKNNIVIMDLNKLKEQEQSLSHNIGYEISKLGTI
jgi:S1-C subfamily serine protease